MYASARPANSGGNACAASSVVRTSTPCAVAERARDAQLLQLVRGVEAVAGLDLDRRHALVDHRLERAARLPRAALRRSPRASPRPSTRCRRRPPRSRRSDAPSSRRSNSWARLPAYTRCVWQSTSPGVAQRSGASIVVAARASRGRSRVGAEPGDRRRRGCRARRIAQ